MPKKFSKYVTLHVYASPEVKKQIEALAKKHMRSVSSEVQFLIDEAHRKEFENASKCDVQRPPLV